MRGPAGRGRGYFALLVVAASAPAAAGSGLRFGCGQEAVLRTKVDGSCFADTDVPVVGFVLDDI